MPSDFEITGEQSSLTAGQLIDFLDSTGVTMSSTARSPGFHEGSGDYNNSWQVIDPASVPGTGLLVPSSTNARIRCYFFEANDPAMLPSHFGVAVSQSLSSFDKVNIFFHPNPDRADPPMTVGDYPDHGSWSTLFRYMPMLGTQLAGAGKQQILIMPYVPSRLFATTGTFAKKWRSIVTGIAKYVKWDLTGAQDKSLAVNSVVVSSFSWGITASDSFRSNAGGLSAVLKEIWDCDGMFSQEKQRSVALRNKQMPRLIQYQQALPTLSNSFRVDPPRWTGIDTSLAALIKKDAVKAGKAVHRNVPQSLFYHAASLSTVG